jgi:protein-disulfide isomerase
VGERPSPGSAPDALRLGAPDPLVEVTVFCDYQCPECRRTERVLAPLLTHFPDEVAIRYRPFPLTSVHPLARDAAVYALAAARQGGFPCLHRTLSRSQRSWTDDPPAAFRARVEGFIAACGLSLAAFTTDASDPALARLVDAETALARDLEARGTPTVFVNGLTPERWPKPGVQTRDLLVPTVRRELAAASALHSEGLSRAEILRRRTAANASESLASRLYGP